jgi:Domain of unknown function (DUF1902)
MSIIVVKADWDSEAEVWVATSGDVPGMVAESPTLEKLRPKVISMIEDLIEEGAVAFNLREIPVHFIASSTQSMKNPVAA